MARPIPEEEPVTMATLFLRRLGMVRVMEGGVFFPKRRLGGCRALSFFLFGWGLVLISLNEGRVG
jgi:hypothetical protein